MYFKELYEYIDKDNNKSLYVGDEPATMYLLAALAKDDGTPILKSSTDENGKHLYGFGFVYVGATIERELWFYKFIIPSEYLQKVHCLKGTPFKEDIIEYENVERPLGSIEDQA